MNEIKLDISQLDIIHNILSKIPYKVDDFVLTNDYSSGIGDILSLSFAYKMGDIEGTFTTVISGVENW
jgi:uncharacterized protein YtpQ (UPF0354 family)